MATITLPEYAKRHQSRTLIGALNLAIGKSHKVGIYASAGHPGASPMTSREIDSGDMWHEIMIALDTDASLVYLEGVGI